MNSSKASRSRFDRLFQIRKLSTRLMLSTFVIAIAIAIVAAISLSLFIPNSATFEKEIKKELGLYTTSYSMTKAANSVTDAKIGDTGYAVMLDSQGINQIHPNPELIGSRIVDLGVPEVYEAFKAVQQGKKEVSYDYTFGGITKIGQTSATKNGYVVQMAVPKNELTAPIRNMMWTTLLAAALVTLAAIAITYVITSRLAKPIVYITDVVQQLSKGDFRPRLHVKSQNEIREASVTPIGGQRLFYLVKKEDSCEYCRKLGLVNSYKHK